MPDLFYCTTNPSKLQEVSDFAGPIGYKILSRYDLDINLEVEETGQTLEENAILKAKAYHERVPDRIVMADDTGIEIDALDGEPGIKVRRWRDGKTDMADEEIIAYCTKRMQGTPRSERGAQFRTVIALAWPNGDIKTFDGTLRGTIVEQPTPLRMPGFPFESLLYIPEWKMMLGDVHQLSHAEQTPYETHRERAVKNAIDYLEHYA